MTELPDIEEFEYLSYKDAAFMRAKVANIIAAAVQAEREAWMLRDDAILNLMSNDRRISSDVLESYMNLILARRAAISARSDAQEEHTA